MKRTLLTAATAFVLASTLSSGAMAALITYNVNRTIGGGSVVGTVETDGTIGVLGAANVLNWDLTLTSPNLAGGSDHITGFNAIVVGAGLIGSLTELDFDFSVLGSGWALQGASGNAWCMASAGISCTTEPTPSESIFFAVAGGPAETEARSGLVTIGSAVAGVPEPVSLALVGVALLAAAGGARRRATV